MNKPIVCGACREAVPLEQALVLYTTRPCAQRVGGSVLVEFALGHAPFDCPSRIGREACGMHSADGKPGAIVLAELAYARAIMAPHVVDYMHRCESMAAAQLARGLEAWVSAYWPTLDQMARVIEALAPMLEREGWGLARRSVAR